MALIRLLAVAAAGLWAQEAQHTCAPCHSEQIADLKSHTKHTAAGMHCSVCHGASEKHRSATGSVPPDRVAAPNEVSALCGNCHREQQKQFDASAHGLVYKTGKKVRTANCSTCHGQHAVRNWNALTAACSRCHTALPAACKGTPKTVNAKVACAGCHAEHTLKTGS